ncbi:hypothetical protein D9758_002560 [Tetrapyrgos nigripes]|uniref:histone acetyltransferase n=1 Tax=Tetrapyrgos nigripes TaxID=182062 RepID=A0A8H5GQQ6_9AGAR|nr:hypothetical protein D9758_002560 [Tetrapyrgos nigripes]
MSGNLRDALLNDLKALPGVREFHLHVVVSAPRKHSTLFQYAQPRCRTYMQDVLVLLSEQPTPDSPRVLVTAIEACVYNIPTTSCAILYISKVDSTGQASYPSPTATLVKSFLLYYTDPTTRPIVADHFWIHLFARAQSQYLFPNSADHPGKRPLSDVKLCSWWKQVLSGTAEKLQERIDSTGTGRKALIKLFYILPGYEKLEAEYTLLKHISSTSTRSSSSLSSSSLPMAHRHQLSWTYGHPYSQTDIPLPCARNTSSSGLESDSHSEVMNNLGNYIPWFDDDPKSRFLDEIAYTADKEGISSPARKRLRTVSTSAPSTSISESNGEGSESVLASVSDGYHRHSGVPDGGPEGSNEKSGDSRNGKEGGDRPLGELGKVTLMSFGRECLSDRSVLRGL